MAKTARYEAEKRKRSWPVTDPLPIDDAEFLFKQAVHALKSGSTVSLVRRKCSRTKKDMLVLERGLCKTEVLCGCESCLHVWREYRYDESTVPHCQLCGGSAQIYSSGD